MIKIYVKEGCPFCERVQRAVEELGISVEFIDAPRGSKNREEMVAIGGKEQVPFLVDGDVHMYESEDIINYLKEKFGGMKEDEMSRL
ncbi:glutaredoxin [Candidatus Woesearchaeota archaeon]|nr:MAG: glutaredoxin [Candidatus Woesearchaeota archaeon]